MKIKNVIFVTFAALTVVPMTAMQVTSMNYYNHKIEMILENDLKVAASTQAEALDNFFEERYTDLVIISNLDFVHKALNAGGGEQKAEALSNGLENILKVRAQQNDYLESVTLLDADFNIVACSEQDYQEDNLIQLRKLDSILRENETMVTPVIPSGDGQKKIVAVFRRIQEGGKIAGYLVEEINLKFFERIRNSASLFNDGTIYMIDGKGNLVTGGSEKETRNDFVLSGRDRNDFNRAWQEREKGSTSGVLRYKALNKRYLSAYTKCRSTNWTLITTVNIDEIMQNKSGYQYLGAIVGFVLLLAFLTVNFIITSKIVKPIENMIGRFRMIKLTKDYSIRMECPKENEIGIIAGEINSLLAHINTYIIEERDKQQKLKERIKRDPLTGLYNKKEIERILNIELEKCQKEGTKVAYLFIDVDDFKQFNTDYGHSGGDRVLQFIAYSLLETGYPAGRVGGDEFVLCVSGVSLSEVENLSVNLLSRFQDGCHIDDCEGKLAVSCSIGGALSNNTVSVAELLEKADQAMYRVKRNGKRNCEVDAMA